MIVPAALHFKDGKKTVTASGIPTEKRLNNCLMLHVHKEFTDSLDLISVAKIFVSAYDERKKYFGNYD